MQYESKVRLMRVVLVVAWAVSVTARPIQVRSAHADGSSSSVRSR